MACDLLPRWLGRLKTDSSTWNPTKMDLEGPSRFLWHGEGPWAFGGKLDCVLGSGDGGQSGGESELGMAKEMDSIVHCRFTTLNPVQFGSPNSKGVSKGRA